MISNEKEETVKRGKVENLVKPVVITNIVQEIMEQINAQDIFQEMLYVMNKNNLY